MKKKKNNERKTVKRKEKEEKGITQSFLEGIPIVGNLIEGLGKTEIFKEKFKEVDKKIKENLEKGEKKKWSFEAGISTRPIFKEVKKECSEIVIEKDYFYGKKRNKLILGVQVPKKETGVRIEGKNLFIKKGIFLKKIELPDLYERITQRQYRKGLLILELIK